MRTWILKTEPEECSLDDIRNRVGGVQRWDGIRNYQARNYLRDDVRTGDRCLIWHSGVREPALVGRASVVRAAYPDPAQFDAASAYHDPKSSADAPRWYAIDIRFEARFEHAVPAAVLRAEPALSGLLLLRHGRLSVSPVSAAEWTAIRRLCGGERRE
jgi:predicted RNA-binding protein with PUA-like domain